MPSGGRCNSDEGTADSLGDGDAGNASNSPDGAGIGEASDSADRISSECDAGTGLLEKESRPLNLSRRDSNLCFDIVDDEAVTHRNQIDPNMKRAGASPALPTRLTIPWASL